MTITEEELNRIFDTYKTCAVSPGSMVNDILNLHSEVHRLREENIQLGESLAQSHHDSGDCNSRIAYEQEESRKIIKEALEIDDLLEAKRLIALGRAVEAMEKDQSLAAPDTWGNDKWRLQDLITEADSEGTLHFGFDVIREGNTPLEVFQGSLQGDVQ